MTIFTILDIAGNVIESWEEPATPYGGCCIVGTGAVLSSLVISGGVTVDPSETLQLTATAAYSNGSTSDVTATATWEESSAAIASVVAGLVTAEDANICSDTADAEAPIGASYGGFSDTHDVSIPGFTYPATEVYCNAAPPLTDTGINGGDYRTNVFWATPLDSSGFEQVLTYYFQSLTYGLGLTIGQGGKLFWYDDSFGDDLFVEISGIAIADGVTYFFVVEFDKIGNRTRVHVNDSFTSSWYAAKTMVTFASTNCFFRARDVAGNRPFTGSLKYALIYERALTSEEQTTLFNQPSLVLP